MASVVLRLVVEGARHLFEAAHWLLWTLPVWGVLQLLLYKAWKLPLNLTTDAVIERMRAGKPIDALLAPGILLATAMTIVGGGSVGTEAGALQIGASLGSTIGKRFHLRNVLHDGGAADVHGINQYMAATGMAAAFSALFFAPLGSCMLVLELMRFVPLRYVCSMLVACFCAYAVSASVHIGDIITTVPVPELTWRMAGVCVVVGIAAAIGGSVFALGIHLVQGLTARLNANQFLWVVVGGVLFAVLVAACGWWRLTGSGGAELNEVLRVPDVSADFLVKMLLTMICLGFWFKGGEIMPSLCIGGLLGSACFAMTGAEPLTGAALGAIAFLAAFNRCPVSAFLLGCEIFGWAMAPCMGITVLVSFLFGYPVGIYGSAIDVFTRSGWQRLTETLRGYALLNQSSRQAGFIDFAMAADRAIKRAAATGRVAVQDEEKLWAAEHPERAKREEARKERHDERHDERKKDGAHTRNPLENGHSS
ncbi:MAG: chloride channel protein [Bifidobacterium sp.]|nr:chloride channel protein [Bifidobacterium sp.]